MGTLEVMDTGYCSTGSQGCGMWQRRTSESGLATTGTSNTGSDNTEVVKTTLVYLFFIFYLVIYCNWVVTRWQRLFYM